MSCNFCPVLRKAGLTTHRPVPNCAAHTFYFRNRFFASSGATCTRLCTTERPCRHHGSSSLGGFAPASDYYQGSTYQVAYLLWQVVVFFKLLVGISAIFARMSQHSVCRFILYAVCNCNMLFWFCIALQTRFTRVRICHIIQVARPTVL